MRIATSGLKGRNHQIELGRRLVVTGANASGKSTLLDALRFLALGYVPAMGKRPADTAALMNGRALSVALTLDDGRTAVRRLEATGKGFTSSAEASWLQDAKPSEHAEAVQKLFGEEELAVAELADVRELLACTASQRAARLQQLLEAGSDPAHQAARAARFTLIRLAGIAEEKCPENHLDLVPLVPAAKIAILRGQAGMLKGKLTEAGVAGALTWANGEKKAAQSDLRQKSQAREELLPRIQELGQFPEEESTRITGERDRVQRELGAAKERQTLAEKQRQALTDATQATDRALGARAKARQERQAIEPELARLPDLRREFAQTEAEIDALVPPEAPDLSDVQELQRRARMEDQAAASVLIPNVPALADVEARLDRATREYHEALDSPWSTVANRADDLIKLAAGKNATKVKAIGEELREVAIAHGRDLGPLANAMLALTEERDRLAAEIETLEAARGAAEARARDHRQEAERLRKAAQELQETATAAHRGEADAYGAARAMLQEKRDTLRRTLADLEARDRQTADALDRADRDVKAADLRRNELGDTAPEIESGTGDLEAELADLTAQLARVASSAAAHAELTRLVREIDDAGAAADVFAALEWALQRTRAEELAQAGGPLVGIMKRFLTAAGRAEVPFFDSKDASMGWRRGERQIHVSALSGAEWVLFTTALNAAMLILRDAPVRLLLVEGDALDLGNMAALLRGIDAVEEDLSAAIIATHQMPPAESGWEVVELQGQEAAAVAA